jgi:hypothetical protein
MPWRTKPNKASVSRETATQSAKGMGVFWALTPAGEFQLSAMLAQANE